MISKKINKMVEELRTLPTEEKGLEEQRNDLSAEMETIVEAAKTEKRTLNETEVARFDEVKAEIEKIDKTLKAIESTRSLSKFIEVPKNNIKENKIEKEDEKRFLEFVRGNERALSVADNGGIIPNHISNKIIETVKELSPIYAKATIYNVGGNLLFPVYDESTSSIGAAFVDDLAELTEGTGKFTTIKLDNYIVGTLAKVSKSLMNRTDFDLLGFIIKKVATSIAEFLEQKLIQGTVGKNEGVLATTNLVEGALTADNLIDLQLKVPEVYQGNACWLMHKDTLAAVRKLKDENKNYLLGTALNGFGFTLLGKPVHFTESMEANEVGKKAVVYGDLSGLYVKLAQNVEVQILNEKYATQHAIGVVGYVEFDSKIVEKQKIAALKITA